MIRAANLRSVFIRAVRQSWRDDHAAQIVEFAVSLPLLVVFVVGIFDFSQALSVKQKLMNAARDAARVAAADPSNDLGGSAGVVPASVSDASQVVDSYLVSENLNDCGLGLITPMQSAGTLQWISTATGNGCPGAGIKLTIDRGCVTTILSGTTTIHLVETCITISYAYNWRFNSVMGLLGGSAAGPNNLTAKATAYNEN